LLPAGVVKDRIEEMEPVIFATVTYFPFDMVIANALHQQIQLHPMV